MPTIKIDKSFRHQTQIDALKAMLTMCTTSAGLTIGSSDKKRVRIANTTNYMIDGVLYQRTAVEVALPSSLGTQAAGTFCKYLVSLNDSGNATVTRGTTAATAADATLPDLPANNCPIGYFQVQVTGSSPFVPGTTELDASGYTVTYVNLASVCI